jgi:hypothetical protein
MFALKAFNPLSICVVCLAIKEHSKIVKIKSVA